MTVFRIVDDAIKVKLSDLEKDVPRQETVASGLVLAARSLEGEDRGNVAEAAVFQVFTACDHVFDVVDEWKVRPQKTEKLFVFARQRLGRQHLDQISKIVVSVEAF